MSSILNFPRGLNKFDLEASQTKNLDDHIEITRTSEIVNLDTFTTMAMAKVKEVIERVGNVFLLITDLGLNKCDQLDLETHVDHI